MSQRPLHRPRPLHATCDAGLESLLARELESLGAREVRSGHRGVSFVGGEQLIWRVNLESRFASRLLIPIGEFPAPHRHALLEGVRRIRWDWWISPRDTIAVDARSRQSALEHTRFISLVVKDGVCDQLRAARGARPSVDRDQPTLPINAHLRRDLCTLSLDSSGDRLHRRGYRLDGGAAPLRETLAAALLERSGWRPGEPLVDLCCGSGTILIEAARQSIGETPGQSRARHRGFAFQRWRGHDERRFQRYLEELDARAEPTLGPLVGADISARAIKRSEENSRRAGVREHLSLSTRPLTSWTREEVEEIAARASNRPEGARRGLLLINPPYGERLGADGALGARPLRDQRGRAQSEEARSGASPEALEEFYRSLGALLRDAFAGWEAWILVAEGSPSRIMRLRPAHRHKLRNGSIPCELIGIPLYAERRDATREDQGGEDDAGS